MLLMLRYFAFGRPVPPGSIFLVVKEGF